MKQHSCDESIHDIIIKKPAFNERRSDGKIQFFSLQPGGGCAAERGVWVMQDAGSCDERMPSAIKANSVSMRGVSPFNSSQPNSASSAVALR